MGGRGASSSLPTAHPSGGGIGGDGGDWSQAPNFKQPDTMKEALGQQGRAMSINQAVRGANPYYDGTYREFSENCQRAVVAYEARRRGYNVTAQPTYEGDKLPTVAHQNKDGSNNAYWMGAFKGAKSEKVGASTANKARQNVENKMKEYGDGSRGILRVQWKDGGGHVLNVERKNGKTHYVDAQIGAKYTPKELFGAIKTGSTQLVRTDNLKLSSRVKNSVETTNRRKP